MLVLSVNRISDLLRKWEGGSSGASKNLSSVKCTLD